MATICCGSCDRRLEGVPDEPGEARERYVSGADWWVDRWAEPPRPSMCPYCGGRRQYVGTSCWCCGEPIVELPEGHADRGEAAREEAMTWCYLTATVMDIVSQDEPCRAGVICWNCLRKHRNDIDMWIDPGCWDELWHAVVPYDRLPILDHEKHDKNTIYEPLPPTDIK